MFLHDEPPRYGAYLLRYWEARSDRPGQPSTWRFTLVQAGEEGSGRGFASLEAMVAFLREELGRGLAGTDSVSDEFSQGGER